MDDQNRQVGRGSGRIWAGLFLLLVGSVLLMDQLGFPFPDWLFTWPVVLIVIGIFSGLRTAFRGGPWFIFILVGGFFLLENNFPYIPLHRFLWPIVLIIIGLLVIARPGRHYAGPGCRRHWRRWDDMRDGNNPYGPAEPNDPNNPAGGTTPTGSESTQGRSAGQGPEGWDWRWHGRGRWQNRGGGYYRNYDRDSAYGSDDFIDSTAIFGGIHKKVVSKDFKGGEVTSILGGMELDFTQADFNGKVILDVTAVLGGTKIIVPSNWEVRTQLTSVMGGFEDKRQQPVATNPDKILILQGTSVLGGIELKNY